MKSRNGYEYEVVGRCHKSKRPKLAPIAWSNQKTPRPVYNTCTCCDQKE